MEKCIILLFFVISIALPLRGQTGESQADYDTITTGLHKPLILVSTRGVAYGSPDHFNNSTLFGEVGVSTSWRFSNMVMNASFRHREGYALGERISIPELREAYAGYVSPHLDLLLGNQIITWGKTDGFNPTNHVTPVDYFLLSGEPDDQKMSNFLLQARIRPVRNTVLTLIAIPVYRPSVYRFELFDMGSEASFLTPAYPDVTIKNGAWAAKADLMLGRADLAVSWFEGYHPEFGFAMDTIILLPKPDIRYRPDYYRTRTAGMAIATPFGKNIFRGEAAWNFTSGYENNMHIPYPDLSYVAGLERVMLGTTAILQYVGKFTPGFTPLDEPVLSNPLDLLAQLKYAMDLIEYESALFNRKIFYQQEKTNHAITLSLIRSFSWDRLSAELSGYYNITSEEHMERVSITWNFSDHLKAGIGGSRMAGPDRSLFDKAAPVMNGAWLSFKATF
ncbi:MAG: hypothetical protein R6V49_07365 [Bacteroidales bacterium]